MQITAYRDHIKTQFDFSHAIDRSKAAAIAEAMDAGQSFGPILVIEDGGNGYEVLDGHHRAQAAILNGLRTVDAWVVSREDMDTLVESEFGGEMPNRLLDLDDYIVCDGATYEQGGYRAA